jgi:SAM-dependent methyltransferase
VTLFRDKLENQKIKKGRKMNSTTLELPPQEFMNAVAGENISPETHVEIGNIFKQLLVDKCSIRPSDSILDIGSGCGRIASRFAGYTIAPYHGFDVVLPMVEWCQENITPRFPNFKFHHAAVKNTLYSDAGIDASDYVFPFEDGTFDVVFAASVFTHLLPPRQDNTPERFAVSSVTLGEHF